MPSLYVNEFHPQAQHLVHNHMLFIHKGKNYVNVHPRAEMITDVNTVEGKRKPTSIALELVCGRNTLELVCGRNIPKILTI